MLARDEDARRILELIVEPQTKGLRMGGCEDARKRGGRERARLASGVKTPEEEGPGTPGLKPRPPEKPLRGERAGKKGRVLYRLEKRKLLIRRGLRRFLIFSV